MSLPALLGRTALAGAVLIASLNVADAQTRRRGAARPAPAAQPAPPPEPPGAPVPPLAQRPQMVVDAETGTIITSINPHLSWHPASLTKMMTVYVALDAVRRGRITLPSMLTVSAQAARQVPSKMGFRPGTQLSLEAAIYILMVKSANDVSVTVAEGVSGSLEAFVEEMNATSRRLGMTATVWRNPNGLHHIEQVTTARDLAVLARALYRDFPEHHRFLRTPAIQYGQATMRNFNPLIGRYPGADGLKTGFICPSGFNLVASATRNGRRHIAIVLGEQSGRGRGERAAMLLERSWSQAGNTGGGLFGGEAARVDAMVRPVGSSSLAPNLRQEICVERRGRGAPSEAEDTETPVASNAPVLALTDEQSPTRASLPGLPAIGAPATGTAAVSAAAGERPPLLAPVPPQVQAVILGRSVVNPRDRGPLRVAVAGFATVGRGVTPPPAALRAIEIPTDGRPPVVPAAAEATANPPAVTAASNPVALVPLPPNRPGAASGAPAAPRASSAASLRNRPATATQRNAAPRRRTPAQAN